MLLLAKCERFVFPDFADFEDAIQCYTAQNHQISTIITRNIKDYKTAGILVQTPEIFLCSQNMI